jgi:hypothetical protein
VRVRISSGRAASEVDVDLLSDLESELELELGLESPSYGMMGSLCLRWGKWR